MSAPPVTRESKHAALAHTIGDQLLAAVVASRAVFPSCLNCAYFNEAHAHCSKYNGTPPPKIIVYACPGYADNEAIPF